MLIDQLLPEGRFQTGLNYWASHAATEMWTDWDIDAIRADFKVISDSGLTILRVFPRWDIFQPIRALRKCCGNTTIKEIRLGEDVLPTTTPEKYGLSSQIMQRFSTFCDLASEFGIKLIVPLLTGQMTTRLYVPEALISLDLFRDPVALKYEVLFCQGFVEYMKDHPAIVAWESGNETYLLGKIGEDDIIFWVWSQLIHSTIRQADPSRPIIGVNVQAKGQSLVSQVDTADCLTVHPYAMWFPHLLREELDRPRSVLHPALDNKMLADIGKMPCFIEETGTWRPTIGSAETLADSLRLILWNAWREDARALLWWCAFDQSGITNAPYDWDWPGCEHGVFTVDRKSYPVAKIIADFTKMVADLPFALSKRKSDAICIINDDATGYSAGILALQSGISLEYQHPTEDLRQADCYFLPSCIGRGGLTNRFWEQLKTRIYDHGATLYISYDLCYLDHLREVSGAAVLSRRQTEDVALCQFADFTIKVPRKFRYQMAADQAKVLAREVDGNPCCFSHKYGQGQVISLSVPLEKNLLDVTGGFECGAYQLYQLILPKQRLFTPQNENILVSDHKLDNGKTAILLTNCSGSDYSQEFPHPVAEQYSDSNTALVKDNMLILPASTGLLVVVK